MQRDRVRRTALAVAVLSAVGAAASATGVGPTAVASGANPGEPSLTLAGGTVSGGSGATGQSGASGLGALIGASDSTGATATTGPTGASGASGPTGATGATSATGASGATSATGTSGTTGPTSATGTSGTTGPTSATGATAATGSSGATGPTTGTTGSTAATGPSGASAATGTTGITGVTGSTGVTGASAATGATGATGAVEWGSTTPPAALPPAHRHHHHRRSGGSGATGATGPGEATPQAPTILGLSTQPQSGSGPASSPGAGAHHGKGTTGGKATGSGVTGGDVAPSPALFGGSNPLSNVLPGAWNDPFIVPGGTAVPQFFVSSFRIPPFLLSIYQAAGTAYGVPWQVLAAINEVETDYGTNLDTSSAGAIGWMQFLPSTWKRYGLDASATGVRDPYNAADAVFSAARYLAAAGAAHNLPAAIFAYNHSWAYVKSVLVRAGFFAGEPTALVQSVTELAEGDFPIQLSYDASYAGTPSGGGDGAAADVAHTAVGATGATGPAPAPGAVGAAAAPARRPAAAATIFADANAAVVADQDGTVIAIGRSRRLGRYVRLRNSFGDTFTYGNLGSVAGWYPALKGQAQSLAATQPAGLAPGPTPNGTPATAGSQSHGRAASRKLFARTPRGLGAPTSLPASASAAESATPIVTLNLASSFTARSIFTPISVLDDATTPAAPPPVLAPITGTTGSTGPTASTGSTGPAAPASLRPDATLKRAGRSGRAPRRATRRRPSLMGYFTGAFGIGPSRLELAPLRVGSHVLAGTILGRLVSAKRPHLLFELQPASSQTPIDPQPFLDAWSQLAAVELHRHGLQEPYYGPDTHATSAGAVLVMSPVDLARVVLGDAGVTMPRCERSAIASGSVGRGVLAALELLALHGVRISVDGVWCAATHDASTAPAVLRTGSAIALQPAGRTRTSAELAAAATRALSPLRGTLRPAISTATLHGDVVISFAPTQSPQALAASAAYTGGFALSNARWSALDARLGQIAEPHMPTAISAAALRDASKRGVSANR